MASSNLRSLKTEEEISTFSNGKGKHVVLFYQDPSRHGPSKQMLDVFDNFQETPGVGDFHGCPFKHFDKPQLQKLLSEFGLNYNEMIPILKYKDTNEYQLACREYFLQTHPGSEGEGVGNHPNSFYEVSRRYSRKQQQKQENPQNSKEGRGEREEKNERRKSDNGGSSDRTNPSQGLGDVPMD
ncbi:dna large subunit [Cystoisospora suis]|uniref:Dna large subunit n=1 Tax=Cystoisospora suis TaxID=483139 RepID=A0A2C6KPU0_9APIC|nr:dna large subunit [Cystoisospora suis]